ncbi:MAG: two-component system sensor-response regulator hybrid [Rhodospirillaceae bacterium]|nr:MAG: two-component system sensor-response regulator hybrid [Rhodospirillaceae bacterium]TNC96426.1 MAG: two-component system sensor-response regulator hybrid protein [Stygiobacter sp.]
MMSNGTTMRTTWTATMRATASDLLIRAATVTAASLCKTSFALLTDNPSWPALCVADEAGAIVGLLGRRLCESILSKPLMLDLYSNRPVDRIMHPNPLVVDLTASIDTIAERIAELNPEALTDGFIVADRGVYVGVASAQDLLLRSAQQSRRRAQQLELTQKAAEEARRTAEKANQAKSTFLANLSHEIRTPLNGVLANLELLGHTAMDGEQRDLSQAAAIAAQALLEIIGDVLDLSKIEAGKLEIEAIPMQPAAVLRDICMLAAGQTARKGLGFTAHIEPSAWFVTHGDPSRLRQVVMNLIGNAVKFTANGYVFLNVLRLDNLLSDQAELLIEIADTGIGFAPEKAERLFAPFSQEDETTSRRFGGTGLGLSICRAIVDMMGGQIVADGTPGGGASFCCRLPLAVAHEGNVNVPPIAGLSVMVVSNDIPRRERLVGGLISQGVSVLGADTPNDALAAMEKAASVGTPFDAILLAIEETAEMIHLPKRLRGLSVVPIMMVARDNVAARRAGYAAGIRHHVGLPARQRDLAWAIASALHRTPALPSAPPPVQGLESLRCQLAPHAAARILVIDDNAMNRQVAERQLAKLGFQCQLADGAQSALTALEAHAFDLILCDVQMPGMDGLSLTRLWRSQEAENHSRRLPIIAMTANALQGDIDSCLVAGMDDYLSKPVKLEKLAAILLRHLTEAPPPPQTANPSEESEDDTAAPVLDRTVLAAILGDDSLAMQADLLSVFLECYPPLTAEIDDAIARQDRVALRRSAHTAKGAARNAAAIALGNELQWLESKAETAAWDDIAAHVRAIIRHYARVEMAILDLMDQAGMARGERSSTTQA